MWNNINSNSCRLGGKAADRIRSKINHFFCHNRDSITHPIDQESELKINRGHRVAYLWYRQWPLFLLLGWRNEAQILRDSYSFTYFHCKHFQRQNYTERIFTLKVFTMYRNRILETVSIGARNILMGRLKNKTSSSA